MYKEVDWRDDMVYSRKSALEQLMQLRWPEEIKQLEPQVQEMRPTATQWRRLKHFLVLFAREHSSDQNEEHVTSAAALWEKANIAGCSRLDVVEALKALHHEGAVSLQKWDWFVHSFQPWQEWQGDSFFDSFRLLAKEREMDR